MEKKIVILTGAGMSAESGLKTFRDSGGLWEGYRIEEVATYEAWLSDPEKVLRFYNERRKAMIQAEPNEGHKSLKLFEEKFDVKIITQNVDNLHERAGSKDVLHLHGELDKARSTKNPDLIYELNGKDINIGDTCELGSQLRPHIVWFGEPVPMLEKAISYTKKADFFIIIGTSLLVYPAASLIEYTNEQAEIYIIDPQTPEISQSLHYKTKFINQKASSGVPQLIKELL
jgi:NAD-dependent deacetylase